jgi:hypothetical protein
VVDAVERRASLKRWLGHPLFISAALTTWLRGYDRSEPHFSLAVDRARLGPARWRRQGVGTRDRVARRAPHGRRARTAVPVPGRRRLPR